MALREFEVTGYAREKAESHGRRIGESPRVAERKLRSVMEAVLGEMQVGEEETFPVPGQAGKREMVIKKMGETRFALGVRQS